MNFIEVQKAFTQHIRDPDNIPAPAGIESRRIEIYRRLLYRNVEAFLSNCYPVIRKITPDDQWHAMIRDYFKIHRARTPLFPRMPKEFLFYLEKERGDHPEDFPFLAELAHYEWAEVELSYDSRVFTESEADPAGDLLAGIPVLNELILPLVYQYPVHKIGPEFLPPEPPAQPAYLLIYRNRDERVGFIELNPVSARLIELLLQQTGEPGHVLLHRIAKELRHPSPDTVIDGGHKIMRLMLAKDIILGTKI
jgi:uncharacterized protein